MNVAPQQIMPMAIAFVLAVGCAGPMRLSARWSDPAFRASSLRKVVVLGVSADLNRRRACEDEFARVLTGRGLTAIPGHALTGEGRPDRAALEARVLEEGADAVLVTRWVGAREMQHNYPPVATYVSVPVGYTSGWLAYYASADDSASATGTALERSPLRLEANLYGVPEDQLAWSALSGTIIDRPASMERDLKACVEALVATLKPAAKRGRS